MSERYEDNGMILHFGEDPKDQYSLVHPRFPVELARGAQAKLLTGALSPDGAIELGRLFEEAPESSEGVWVFEDSSGVRTRFIPGKDTAPFDATWTVERPECTAPEEVIRTLYNSDLYRRPACFYGGENGTDTRPEDCEMFGAFPKSFLSGLTDPHISSIHFGIGLRREGGVFVRDVGSTNGTFICVKGASEAFGPSVNRSVGFPHGTAGTRLEEWEQKYMESILNALFGGRMPVELIGEEAAPSSRPVRSSARSRGRRR